MTLTASRFVLCADLSPVGFAIQNSLNNSIPIDMTDHLDAPPELMPLEACDCCGVPSSYRRGSIWHGQSLICIACFVIWYEYAITNPKELRSERLRLCGTEDYARDAGKATRALMKGVTDG